MRTLCFVLATACSAPISPLSLDVSYSADAKRLDQAASLSRVRIGVARFKDLRPRLANDIHASSYVAHDRSYHIGMTWDGRTFTPVATVVQALLVKELVGAGLTAEALGVEVDPDDLPGARSAGEREHFDVVVGGLIREFQYNSANQLAGEPTVTLEATLFDVAGGKPLLHLPLSEKHQADTEVTPQQRIDEVLNRSFQPVARDLVVKVAGQVTTLIATATQEAAKEAEAQAAAQPAVVPPPEVVPANPDHPRHRPKRGRNP